MLMILLIIKTENTSLKVANPSFLFFNSITEKKQIMKFTTIRMTPLTFPNEEKLVYKKIVA